MMTDLIIKLFIKNNTDVLNPAVRSRYGSVSGFVGIFCNLALCIMKISAGILTASISIIADGFNNLSDMGSSVVTMIGFRLAAKPADREHPYGHGRIEYMSALIVSLLILLVGFELFRESISSLIGGDPLPHYSTASAVILVISVLVKMWMFFFNRALAKRIDSETLNATAQDSINDCIASLVILLCIILQNYVDLRFNLDAWLGIGVSIFIFYSGFCSARETVKILLGSPPNHNTVSELEKTILSFDSFCGIHDLIVHNYGPGREFASVHVEVPHDIDIVACHEKIDTCERLVNEKLGIDLVIHMDPIETDNAQINEAKNIIAGELHKLHENLTIHDFRMTPRCENCTNFIFDVVVPHDLKLTKNELRKHIDSIAKNIDPTYYCVITFDNDYSNH